MDFFAVKSFLGFLGFVLVVELNKACTRPPSILLFNCDLILGNLTYFREELFDLVECDAEGQTLESKALFEWLGADDFGEFDGVSTSSSSTSG